MKKLKQLMTLIAVTMTLGLYAQTPQQINYQAVVRTSAGTTVSASTPVTLQFIIHNGSATGTAVYTETSASLTANQFGLVTTAIGANASLAAVNWTTGSKWLQVKVDVGNTGTFTDMGTTQLNAVPYALFAANSPAGATGPAGANGIDGATGAAGIDGADGATGPTGAQGIAGPTGAQGNDGPAGAIGAQGIAGPTGSAGATGAQGIAGPTGSQGMDGATGPAGPTGIPDPALLNPQVGFSIIGRHGDDSIAAGMMQTVNFYNPAFNDGGGVYDAATGTYTVPSSGIYTFSAFVEQSAGASGTAAMMGFVIDGASYEGWQMFTLSPGGASMHINYTRRLTAGQTITVKCSNSGGGVVVLNQYAGHNGFSGYKIY